MSTQRRYDIDWLRVIAIGLLLIYHIAIVFQPWAMFTGFIRSDELMEGLWIPMTVLNVWRIPFLFFVSGMGVYFAMKKRNWKQLIAERTLRILLPFAFGLMAIVPLHILIFQAYYNMPLKYMAHPGHLWFLGNIFCYVLVLAPLFFFLKQHRESKFSKAWYALMGHPAGLLSISILFVIEVLVIKPQVFEVYALTSHGFALGLLAFLFGFLFVYGGATFWKTVLTWRWLYLGLAIGLYTVRFIVFETQGPLYLKAIESNLWIFSLFGFGYKHLNHSSATLSYLSQAAYPIYIIHMFFLYLGTWLILPLTIPVILKLVLIISFTFLGCFGTYELVIRRLEFLRPLFGLKLTSQGKPAKNLAKMMN